MKTITRLVLALSMVSVAYAADGVVSAVHGSVDSIDSASKRVVVKTADGTKHSLHLVKETVVHGADASPKGTEGSWHGVEKGSEVVAHYTKRGTEDTALELDRVGKGDLKVTRGQARASIGAAKQLSRRPAKAPRKPSS